MIKVQVINKEGTIIAEAESCYRKRIMYESGGASV